MDRTSYGLALAAVVAAATGCVLEVEDPAAAHDAVALDHVEGLGFAREDAVFSGDRVIVGGDMRFDRAALLRGDYERTETAAQGGELIEKGYRYPAVIAAKHRANIRLVFDRGAHAPSDEVREAFIAAAKAWSSIPGSSIRISTTNTGPSIVVRQIPAGRFVNYSGCKDTDACSDVPLNGRPGYEILIRSESTVRGCAKWAGSNLVNVTRHELGHALGFAHPKERGSKHVSGTGRCSRSSEATCLDDLDYSTVMGAPSVGGRCSVSPARLTKDDYATSAAVYPSK